MATDKRDYDPEAAQEIKWTASDWADWLGVDEEDLEDALDSYGDLYE